MPSDQRVKVKRGKKGTFQFFKIWLLRESRQRLFSISVAEMGLECLLPLSGLNVAHLRTAKMS